MPYRVVFVHVDGILETDIGPTYGLAATEREGAEAEAWKLPPPHGTNFFKLIRDGQYESPKIGFAL